MPFAVSTDPNDANSFILKMPLRRLRFVIDAVQRIELHPVLSVWFNQRGALVERCLTAMEFNRMGNTVVPYDGAILNMSNDSVEVFQRLVDTSVNFSFANHAGL